MQPIEYGGLDEGLKRSISTFAVIRVALGNIARELQHLFGSMKTEWRQVFDPTSPMRARPLRTSSTVLTGTSLWSTVTCVAITARKSMPIVLGSSAHSLNM